MTTKLKNKLSTLAILSNKERFSILSILLTSKVLKLGKHSHSFSDLEEISGIGNTTLSCHLRNLINIDLVREKRYLEGIFYSITDKGERILSSTGLDADKIKEMKN